MIYLWGVFQSASCKADLRSRHAEKSAQTKLRVVQCECEHLRRRTGLLECENKELKEELCEANRVSKRQDGPLRRRQLVEKPKKPGRKCGHPAANRAFPTEYDEDIGVPLTCCPDCGTNDISDIKDLAPQFVVDIPQVVRAWVKRFRNQSGCVRRLPASGTGRHADQTSTAIGAGGCSLARASSRRESTSSIALAFPIARSSRYS